MEATDEITKEAIRKHTTKIQIQQAKADALRKEHEAMLAKGEEQRKRDLAKMKSDISTKDKKKILDRFPDAVVKSKKEVQMAFVSASEKYTATHGKRHLEDMFLQLQVLDYLKEAE